MKIGYARVSTEDQNLDRQITALEAAGCIKIYQEKMSGKNADRPELSRLLQTVKPGDILVVQKLDRLGRSLRDLIKIVDDLNKCGVGFISLNESFDTTNHYGRLLFQVFGALAEFERSIILERT